MNISHIVLLTVAVAFCASCASSSFAHSPLHGPGSSHHPSHPAPVRDHSGYHDSRNPGASEGGVTVTSTPPSQQPSSDTNRDHRTVRDHRGAVGASEGGVTVNGSRVKVDPAPPHWHRNPRGPQPIVHDHRTSDVPCIGTCL